MSIYSLSDHESGNVAQLTASIERCAVRSAEVNDISPEDFTVRLETAVDCTIAGQDSPVETWYQQNERFNVAEVLGRVGILNQQDIAVPPFVRLLHKRIKVMEELGEY